MGPCRGIRYRIFPGMGLSPIYGGWEEDAQNLMLKHIEPGHVAYDLGANYGIHALLLARLVQKEGLVVAFEPVPQICSALQENVALNGFTNVTCVRAAVSDQTGTTSFVTGHHVGAGHISAVGDEQGISMSVKTVTLDDFVYNQKNRPPDFIKIDIEGAEGNALMGAEKLLRERPPILLVDLHNPEQDVTVGKILSKNGYTAHRTEDGSQVNDLLKGWPCPDGVWGQV